MSSIFYNLRPCQDKFSITSIIESHCSVIFRHLFSILLRAHSLNAGSIEIIVLYMLLICFARPISHEVCFFIVF